MKKKALTLSEAVQADRIASRRSARARVSSRLFDADARETGSLPVRRPPEPPALERRP